MILKDHSVVHMVIIKICPLIMSLLIYLYRLVNHLFFLFSIKVMFCVVNYYQSRYLVILFTQYQSYMRLYITASFIADIVRYSFSPSFSSWYCYIYLNNLIFLRNFISFLNSFPVTCPYFLLLFLHFRYSLRQHLSVNF